jgi:methyl-accepting chemotaxis protein
MLRAFANLKLVYKLLVPLSILVVVIGAILWTARGGIGELNAATNTIVEKTAARRALMLTVVGALNDATVQEKNIILETGEAEMAGYHERYKASFAEAIAAVDRLIQLADSPERRAVNEALKAAALEFQRATEKSVALGLKNEKDAAFKVSHGEARPARIKVVNLAQERVRRQNEEMAKAQQDIAALQDTVVSRLYAFAAVGLVLALGLLAGIIMFLVVRPLGGITGSLQRLAAGDLGVDVPGADRKDEVGALAKSLQVFKENARQAKRLAAEQEELKVRAAAEQKAAMNKMADAFEASVGGIVGTVASASTEMQGAAQSLTATAEEASRQATAVAAAATQASANVQTVATAAEELSASIAEISRQVAQSSQVASKAVGEAKRTDGTVQSLAAAAQKIGEVVGLIQNIAGQTNLLALNATIEAARAGDAGKGFAVVASEVKALANQTAKATDEIAGHIAAIQGATGDAVAAIRSIGATIEQVNEIAAAIASAVEEQGAATKEIAGNVQQAAAGTDDVSSNIAGVTQASGEVGAAATQVLGSAGELSKQSERLRQEVETFLATVRSA